MNAESPQHRVEAALHLAVRVHDARGVYDRLALAHELADKRHEESALVFERQAVLQYQVLKRCRPNDFHLVVAS